MGAKTEPKSIPKRSRNLRAKKSHLGTDSGRFCVVLGGVRGAFSLIFYWFLYYFVKNGVFEKSSSQDPSWADLGPIWVAKRGPRGGLLEAKLGSKRVRKNVMKKVWS